jgi:hypothetical protein
MLGGRTDRQTATLNYKVSTMQETKPRMTPQKTSRLLMGLEQVMRSETLMVIFSETVCHLHFLTVSIVTGYCNVCVSL